MARRAAWLASGRELSPDVDNFPSDQIPSVLCSGLAADVRANHPARYALARFGYLRWRDAQRADPRDAEDMVTRRLQPVDGKSPRRRERKALRRIAYQIEATKYEPEVVELVRSASEATARTIEPMRKLALLRMHERRLSSYSTGSENRDPYEEILAVANWIDELHRYACGERGPGLRGMNARVRTPRLDDEVLTLREAGVSITNIAFIFGSPTTVSLSQYKAIEQRLRRACARREARSGPVESRPSDVQKERELEPEAKDLTGRFPGSTDTDP